VDRFARGQSTLWQPVAAQHHRFESRFRRPSEIFARRKIHCLPDAETARYESDLFRLAIFDRYTGTSRVLTESFRNWVDAFQWASDSKSLYFDAPVEGDNPIFRVTLDSGSIQQVLLDRAIDSFELTSDNHRIVYTRRSFSDPIEIYAVDLADGKSSTPQRLSHFNDEVANEVDIRPAERIWVKGARNED